MSQLHELYDSVVKAEWALLDAMLALEAKENPPIETGPKGLVLAHKIVSQGRLICSKAEKIIGELERRVTVEHWTVGGVHCGPTYCYRIAGVAAADSDLEILLAKWTANALAALREVRNK